MKPDHLSPSQIGMLGKCGEQYRRRYVEGERVPPGIAQIRGRATHSTNEKNLVHKLATGGLLPLDEIAQLAADQVKAELAGEWVLGADYEDNGVTVAQARGIVTDEVVGLTRLHATELAPKAEPEALEVRVEVPASDALPVKLVGVIDLIDRVRGVRDTKTAQKSPKAEAAHESDQLTAYDLMHRALKGAPPKNLGLDHLIRTPKKGELRVVTQDTSRSIEDLGVFVRRANAALRSIETEVFLPAPQDHWVCSTRWCGYAATCPYFRGRARPTT